MRKFYLLRHEDVHNNSGTGVVAEGVIFDNGMGALTWLTDEPTVTTFVRGVRGVKRLHGHDGKTEVIIEGVKKDAKRFEHCQDVVRTNKAKRRHREDTES
jgi:hypothetical protein